MSEEAWTEIRQSRPQRICTADLRAVEVKDKIGRISRMSVADLDDMHCRRMQRMNGTTAYERPDCFGSSFTTHWRWPDNRSAKLEKDMNEKASRDFANYRDSSLRTLRKDMKP